jgi:putative flippase GtrA
VTFLVVGVLGAVVDLSTYNILVYWDGRGPMAEQPVLARVLATLIATVATYVGNALLTYRDRRRSADRIVAYGVVNVVAIGIQAACLAFSRYVLGLDGPLADNVAGTGVGLVLSTAFRYVAYPRWVFVRPAADGELTPRPLA